MSEVYYYLSAYNDEVCPHLPTLESAAWFLQHGTSGPDDASVWAPVADDLPLCAPGYIVKLDTLTILGDVTARFRGDEVAGGWTFEGVLPPDADFAAVRCAPGASWDVGTITNPKTEDLERWLSETGYDDGELPIVFGVMGHRLAEFTLGEDGTPRLTLIDPPSEAPLFPGERSFESLSKAELDVLAERFRQVSEEGFTPEKDDAYVQGELARAAACYALGPKLVPIDGRCAESARPAWWPWDRAWWKPKGRRADLVRAGALILAEIERMDREEARQSNG